MEANHSRQIFINLPVRDLKRSVAFFTKLGFEFNPQFTNDLGACMIISDSAFAMLLTEEFFKGFVRKPLSDATRFTGALYALMLGSRAEVDAMVNTALAAGGSAALEPMDQGAMYGWSFYDPDGHHWEVGWMDPVAVARYEAGIDTGAATAS